MKLITRQRLADEAASEFGKQYSFSISSKFSDALSGLVNLGSSPNPDDVDKITGNRSWTTPNTCDECGERGESIVLLGGEPDYDSSTAYICKKCLVAALKLIEKCEIMTKDNENDTPDTTVENDDMLLRIKLLEAKVADLLAALEANGIITVKDWRWPWNE